MVPYTGYNTSGTSTYICEYDWADASSTGDSWKQIKYIQPVIKRLEYKIGSYLYNNASENINKYSKWTTDGFYSWGASYNDLSITSASWIWGEDDPYWGTSAPPIPIPASDRLRDMIRQRQAPAIIVSNRRRPMETTNQLNELRARATLRRVLGDDQFRRFLKNGFITVRALSGKIYQIYPGHGMTMVWQNGKPIEKLCVVLSGNFPPTDSMIMRYLMILNDEDDFRSRANVFNAPSNTVTPARTNPDHTTPLPDLYRKLKAA